MACVAQGSGTGGIANWVSEWLPLLLNVFLAVAMLKAQEDAEEAMMEIADKSLSAAEELFAAHMEILGFESSVYAFANSQPLYTPCDRSVHALGRVKRNTAAMNAAIAGTSRFDCGERKRIAYDAIADTIISIAAEKEQIYEFERTIEDAYIDNHYKAIVNTATARLPNFSDAFNSSAAIWGEQLLSASAGARGSLASTTYYLGRIF